MQMKSEGSLMENLQIGKIMLIGSSRFFYGCIESERRRKTN